MPHEFAMDAQELESAIAQAQTEARAQSISGAALTPFLLARTAQLTNNRSLRANIALLINNARLAAQLACELHRLGSP